MKFFYNISKVEDYEYIVLRLEEDGFSGIGAILPIRKKGENYKIFMGIIEEYRSLVEHTSTDEAFSITEKLNKHFPGHPKVTFAIQAAMISLFSKKHSIEIQKLVGGLETPRNELCGERLFPEYVGDVLKLRCLAQDSSSNQTRTYVLTKYPKNEMDEVLSALSTNFKYLEVLSWRELL
uniref:Uncharacterized protein n=1 Tax=Fervidobacterium thailandense TaxID=1008305 RepID=A0A7C4GI26_9BACT